MKLARKPTSSRPKPRASLKKRILPARRFLPVLVGRKQTLIRDQLFSQKPSCSYLWFSGTGVQHSPGSPTIELPTALTKSGAYPPNRALPGSPRKCYLPLACRHLPKGTKLGLGSGVHLGAPSSTNHTAAASQPIGRVAKTVNWLYLSRVIPALHLPERTSNSHTPKPGVGGRGHEVVRRFDEPLDIGRCHCVMMIGLESHRIG